jgi:hypothetical protein
MDWNAVLDGQLHIPDFYSVDQVHKTHIKLVPSKIQSHNLTNDILLCYMNRKNEVQTINHNYINISLLLATFLGFCDKLPSGKLRIHR